MAAVPLTGKTLSSLGREERGAVLARLAENDKSFWFVRAATAPMKIAQARTHAVQEAFGMNGRALPVARERHRWEEQIVDARTLDNDETLEVDVVVVGTGAGGAPVAKELASRGHAVVMVEAGGYFSRADFHGRAFDRQREL